MMPEVSPALLFCHYGRAQTGESTKDADVNLEANGSFLFIFGYTKDAKVKCAMHNTRR